MFQQFLVFLILGTLLFLALVCGLMVMAYRHRQAQRSAPPRLWGLSGSDDLGKFQSRAASSHSKLIATIGYSDRSKLITRN